MEKGKEDIYKPIERTIKMVFIGKLAAGGESESGRLEREIVESRARLMDFNLIRSTRK